MITLDELKNVKAGDIVSLTGVIYTARDQAHKKLEELVNSDDVPSFLNNSIIYYAGPTPTKPGYVVGSIGPTTSARMDKFAYLMPKLGVIATIGKGERSALCIEEYKKNHTMYFLATGGCGALISKSVTKCEEIMFKELGTESIKRLEVKDFKVICAIDYNGNTRGE